MATIRKPNDRLVKFLCLLARRHGLDFVEALVKESETTDLDPYLVKFCKEAALTLTPPPAGRVLGAAKARKKKTLTGFFREMNKLSENKEVKQ